jgi:hypothetical protein
MLNGIPKMKWRRLDGRRIEEPIEAEVERILQRERSRGHRLKVYIGSDSQVRGKMIEFATVIVFLREKSGGFMLVSNESRVGRIALKERLLYEVARSVEIAYRICKLLDTYEVDLEVHADINTNPQFKSNATLQDAMGYIIGMGFEFKAKPDAFASTSCANKVC